MANTYVLVEVNNPIPATLTKDVLKKILARYGDWWPIWTTSEGRFTAARRTHEEPKPSAEEYGTSIIHAIWLRTGEYTDVCIHIGTSQQQVVCHSDIFDYDDFTTE